MTKFLSLRLLLIENAIAIVVVIVGAERSMGVQLIGWALLLPGSALAAGLDCILAPLTGRPGGEFWFWNLADVVFLPACVALNVLAFWIAVRLHSQRAEPHQS